LTQMMSCDYDDVFGLNAISLFDTHFEYLYAWYFTSFVVVVD